jgi:predicted kinase
MEAVIFCGLQASGKTTLYKEKFFDTHVRINLDMLRTRHREKTLFQACLLGKSNLVVDNTNTLRTERELYILPAKQARFHIVGYYFIPDLESCVSRNANRKDKRPIPEKGIYGTKKQLQEPAFDEGFDEIYHVLISPKDGRFLIRKIEQ